MSYNTTDTFTIENAGTEAFLQKLVRLIQKLGVQTLSAEFSGRGASFATQGIQEFVCDFDDTRQAFYFGVIDTLTDATYAYDFPQKNPFFITLADFEALYARAVADGFVLNPNDFDPDA